MGWRRSDAKQEEEKEVHNQGSSSREEERLQHSTALMDWLLKAPEAVRLASQIRGWQDTLVQS